jgi:hypothetical protein
MKNALNILVEKHERRRPFWRYKSKDNMKMDLNEVIIYDSVDRIYVAQNTVDWRYVMKAAKIISIA